MCASGLDGGLFISQAASWVVRGAWALVLYSPLWAQRFWPWAGRVVLGTSGTSPSAPGQGSLACQDHDGSVGGERMHGRRHRVQQRRREDRNEQLPGRCRLRPPPTT